MTAAVPRKRTLAALLLIGAGLGGVVGAIDRARGVPPSADAIFSRPPVTLSSRPGQPAAAPVTSTAGAAGLIESTAK